ncbi:MAG: endoribonuclease L-PSP [Bacillota bacterium]|nr:MAG: endoribonuclease L-PSP [Bacillota bacterium]
MSIEARLLELGITIPQATKPVAAYVPAVRTGNLIFVSGQLPMVAGELKFKGILGRDVDVAEGYEAARICAINCLAAIKTIEPDLNRIKRIVKVTGFVNSVPESGDQPKVVNGASELLQSVFGDRGIHARAAIGMSGLPLNAAVEVEMIVEVE